MIDRNNVADEDIRRVIEGFIEFMRQAIEKNKFEFEQLKKFMEPIFERTGYRLTQGGGE